jgi:hypothetical protein
MAWALITPLDDGRWKLTGALNLSTVIGDSAREAGRVTDNESSGGVMLPYSVTPFLAPFGTVLTPQSWAAAPSHGPPAR